MLTNKLDLTDVYIEKCDKETEEVLAVETASFLEQPLKYLQNHKNEFIYIESMAFGKIGVESISLEMDDVFGTYDVMLGLQLQKKYGTALKDTLNRELQGEGVKFDLIFNQQDGLWDFNFTLDFVPGFNPELSLHDAFQLIYSFLNKLVEEVRVGQ